MASNDLDVVVRIGVLTSSRADYGIYVPLLKAFSDDKKIQLEIIAFGMHLQESHGYTVRNIEQDGFGKIHKVYGMPVKDSVEDVARGYGEVIRHFASFWASHQYEWVFALGDRFEMSAAVQAGIPFCIKFAHIHGGETTLGAIDNIYRHQITLASKLHFTATQTFAKKVKQLTGQTNNIYNVGALSLDGIDNLQLPEWKEVAKEFNIPEGKAFVLVTFHPETVNFECNQSYARIVYETLKELCLRKHLVITLANADTFGSLFREIANQLKKENPKRVSLVTSFGKVNYFSAMKACDFLLGNTSSGILEAASFQKWVINVGDRQAGRLQSDNIINVPFDKVTLLSSVDHLNEKKPFQGQNRYYKPKVAQHIKEIISHA